MFNAIDRTNFDKINLAQFSNFVKATDQARTESAPIEPLLEKIKKDHLKKKSGTYSDFIKECLQNRLKEDKAFLFKFIEESILAIWPTLIFKKEDFVYLWNDLNQRITILPDGDLWLRTLILNLVIEKDKDEILSMLQKYETDALLSEIFKEALQFSEQAEQYGYKGAYLDRLSQHVGQISKVTTKIAVPPFLPISDTEIKQCLESDAFEKLWQEFCEYQRDKQTLSAEGAAILLKIQELIKKTFTEIPDDHPLLQKLLTWMRQEIDSDPNTTFTCRSSSREDKRNVVNAGGNETVPYVTAEVVSIKKALAAVIGSYFGYKSMSQRLGSDRKILDIPLLATLFQKRIGEPLEGEDSAVIISGVANSKRGVKAAIDAHPGFGEKVVGGQNGTDHYLVTLSGRVFDSVKYKSSRLVSSKTKDGIVQIEKALPESVRKTSSLPLAVVRDLAQVIAYFERKSGNSRDIEFVYDPKSNTIFLVQDRPLPAEQECGQAAQFVTSEIKKYGSEIEGNFVTLLEGDSSVKIIEKREDVIIDKDLPSALDQFLRREDKASVKCVLVERWGSPRSHPALIFKYYSVSVLQGQNFNFSNFGRELLIIDLQQSKMFSLPKDLTPIIEQKQLVTKGQIYYPASENISFCLDEGLTDFSIPREYQKDYFPEITLKELVHMLKGSDQQKMQQALYSIFHRLLERKVEYSSLVESELSKEIKQCLLSELDSFSPLINHVFSLYPDLMDCLKYPEGDLRRLAPIYILERLLFQTGTEEEIDVWSFESFHEQFLQRRLFYRDVSDGLKNEILTKSFVRASPFFSLAYEGCKRIFNEDLRHEFLCFMSLCWQYGDSALIDLFQKAQALDVDSALVNICFAKTWKESKQLDPHARIKNCILVLEKEINDVETFQKNTIMKQLKVLFNELAHLKGCTPEEFEKIVSGGEDSLSDDSKFAEYLGTISGKKLKYIFSKSGLLTKYSIISLMHRFINEYDAAIKSLKSPHYKSIDIIKAERRALSDLQLVFGSWGAQPYLSKQQVMDLAIKYQFEKINACFDKLLGSSLSDEELLYPSPIERFNLEEVVVGNGRLCYGSPKTYEDLFTWLHQNLEVLVSSMVAQHLSPHMRLPQDLQNFVTMFESAPFPTNISGETEAHPKRTFLNFSKRAIYLKYNLILVCHSALFDIEYPLKGNTVELTVNYFGRDEGYRWTLMQAVLKLSQYNLDIECLSPPSRLYAEYGCLGYKMKIQLENSSQLAKAQETILLAHQFSVGSFWKFVAEQKYLQLIGPEKYFKNVHQLVNTILTQDPKEAYELYLFLASIYKALSKEDYDLDELKMKLIEAAEVLETVPPNASNMEQYVLPKIGESIHQFLEKQGL